MSRLEKERLLDLEEEKKIIVPKNKPKNKKNYVITDYFTKLEEINTNTFLEPAGQNKFQNIVEKTNIQAYYT